MGEWRQKERGKATTSSICLSKHRCRMEEVIERKSKWGKVGKVAAILLSFILLAAAGAYTWTGIPSGAAYYPKMKRAAEAAGLFFDEKQVLALTTVPDADNSASLIEKIDIPKIEEPYYLNPKIINEKWKEIEPGLQQLELAETRKYFVSKWDFKDRKRDHFESPRSLSRAESWVSTLNYIAMGLLETPTDARLPRCLRVASHLTGKLDQDHTINGMSLRISRSLGLESTIRKLIPRSVGNPTLLAALDDALKSLDKPYDLVNLMKVENFRGILAVEHFLDRSPRAEAFDGEYGLPVEISKGSTLPRFREANLSRIHEYYSLVASRLPKDPYDFDGLDRAMDYGLPVLGHEDWSSAVLRYGLETPQAIPKRIRMENSYRNTLMQAVAMLKAHADPAKGLLLGGHYRWDLDGSPIRIAKLPKGWVVYSIGRDFKDDGGMDASTRPPDYVAHLTMATVIPEPPRVSPSKPSGAPAPGPAAPSGTTSP